jgi:hypothetical protein
LEIATCSGVRFDQISQAADALRKAGLLTYSLETTP